MNEIEKKVLQEWGKIELLAETGHRIIKEGREVYIEISANGYKGFMKFSCPVTYYRFSGESVGRSPVPNSELEKYASNNF